MCMHRDQVRESEISTQKLFGVKKILNWVSREYPKNITGNELSDCVNLMKWQYMMGATGWLEL